MFSTTDLIHMSIATNAEIDVPRPLCGKEFFPFQKAGIAYSLAVGNTLFADEPGLGKTIQSIGVMNCKDTKRNLIVCPASLQLNWKKEIELWSHREPKVVVYDNKASEKDLRDCTHVVVSAGKTSNVNHIKEIIKLGPFDLGVFDECHFFKNPKAKRTKFAFAANGLVSVCKTVHAISGTPIVNRPMEIFPIVRGLKWEAINKMSQFDFGLHYCAGWKTPWGSWDFNGASNTQQLGRRLRASLMVRRKKKDVLKDLPEKQVGVVYCSSTKEGEKVLSRMGDFDLDDVATKVASAEFSELSELRHALGVSKIAFVADYVRTQFEGGHRKILLFAHHKEVVKGLSEALHDFNPMTVTGQTPHEERQAAVDKFQSMPQVKVFIATIGSMNVGHTLTAASYVIFAEPDWVPGNNEQAMDRTHRIGQQNNVLVEFIVHEKSIDERVVKQVLQKMEVIKGVLDVD